MWAKQSTAATLIVGPILDSAGAEFTTAVIGDLSISKTNAGTLTALAAAATLDHIANGQYKLVLTTGNLDTLGRLQITCNRATYQMPPVGLTVVPAMVFDSMVLGTDVLQSDTIQFGGTNGTFDAGKPTAVLDSAATAALVDLIWDEPLTGATHNVATSSGKRLRQSTAFQQIDSTVIDASATTTTFVTGLTSAVDDFYNDSMLVFTDGALAGQVRSIVDYVGATKTIVLEEPLTSAPVNGVAFTIVSLHIHPVSQIQSGLATSAALAAAKTILDKVDTGLVVDGAVYQFTANMLELGPSGGGGGGSGDATLAKQEEILTQLDVIQTKTDTIGSVGAITSLLAAAVLEPGTITSFPETLTIGDSYTEQNGREIQIPIVDTDGTPLSSTGSLNFADASVTFTLQRSGETDSTRVITGTATFVDPPGTGTGAGAPYAVIELPASETAKGLKKYKYSGILTFTWTGTGTDVMSFETDTVTFDN